MSYNSKFAKRIKKLEDRKKNDQYFINKHDKVRDFPVPNNFHLLNGEQQSDFLLSFFEDNIMIPIDKTSFMIQYFKAKDTLKIEAVIIRGMRSKLTLGININDVARKYMLQHYPVNKINEHNVDVIVARLSESKKRRMCDQMYLKMMDDVKKVYIAIQEKILEEEE